jgi:hypothetical protein
MALTAGVELKPGDEIEIEFTPPYSSSPIRISGAVRNRAGYRYGIEFVIESREEAQEADRLRMMLTSMSASPGPHSPSEVPTATSP